MESIKEVAFAGSEEELAGAREFVSKAQKGHGVCIVTTKWWNPKATLCEHWGCHRGKQFPEALAEKILQNPEFVPGDQCPVCAAATVQSAGSSG